MEKVEAIKDLGVHFDRKLSFTEHIQQKINKAYSMLCIIKHNFIHMNKKTFILLYKAIVRPHLEYASSVWCPYKKGDMSDIEKVQRPATKLVPGFRKLSYANRLKRLCLLTLKYRRLHGDMTEV